jgi:hypothetical protein
VIILDTNSKSIEVVLAGAVTTNQLPIVANWVEITASAYTPGNNELTTNNTTAVTAVPAPGAGSVWRQVKGITIPNDDTVPATVTVRLKAGVNTRTLYKVTLAVGSLLEYNDAAGFRVLDANGNVQVATSSADVKGPSSSVDSEIALFNGTTGKTLKRATGTGLVTATAGVFATTTTPTTDKETIGGLTVTADDPALRVTQTWNNAGVTFNGVVVDVTNTASSGTSKLMDLRLAGVSLFAFDRNGVLTTQGGVNAPNTGYLGWSGRSRIYSSADGQIDAKFNDGTTAATVNAGGFKASSKTAGFGYATGAGGSQTQATSKSQAVTLNAACGQITMNAASLAANTAVSFTLTNSSIAAGDTLNLNHISGGTGGAYLLNAQCAAGSAVINVRNLTAGALAEAIVIAFAIVKATTS